MPSTHARSTKPKYGIHAMGVQLDATLLTRIGENRAQQAAALGISENALYRWIGGIGRDTGVNLATTTVQRVANILGAPKEEAWKPAPLPQPRATKIRDPRRSAAARHAANARWHRNPTQKAA
jgi:hypothetical protein